MTIFVDKLEKVPFVTGRWQHAYFCHMGTNGDLAELHAFAKSIGLEKEWFQDHKRVPHYDLTQNKRLLAVRRGAVEVSSHELFAECQRNKNENG